MPNNRPLPALHFSRGDTSIATWTALRGLRVGDALTYQVRSGGAYGSVTSEPLTRRWVYYPEGWHCADVGLTLPSKQLARILARDPLYGVDFTRPAIVDLPADPDPANPTNLELDLGTDYLGWIEADFASHPGPDHTDAITDSRSGRAPATRSVTDDLPPLALPPQFRLVPGRKPLPPGVYLAQVVQIVYDGSRVTEVIFEVRR